MLVDLKINLLPALQHLQVPFSVVRGNKDISDFVEVDVPENCLEVVEKQKASLHIIGQLIQKTGRRA